MVLIVNGTVSNGYEYDATCHTWICSTNTLVLFKDQISCTYATALPLVIYRWSTHSRNFVLMNN